MRSPRRPRLAAPFVITVAGLTACAPEPIGHPPLISNPPPPELQTAPVANPPAAVDPAPLTPPAPLPTGGNPPPPPAPPPAPPAPPHRYVNPPPPQHAVPALPAATNPARIEKHPDGTCWEPFNGNPPGQRPVRCP